MKTDKHGFLKGGESVASHRDMRAFIRVHPCESVAKKPMLESANPCLKIPRERLGLVSAAQGTSVSGTMAGGGSLALECRL